MLRPLDASDAAEVRRMAGAREVADTTLTVPHPYPDGAAEAWIATHAVQFEQGTGIVYAVTLAGTGELIGAIGLQIAPGHAQGEVGYWIGHEHWGHGYCTEAARAVVALALGALGLHRVDGRHLVRNAASGRVMEKLGMRFEGVHRQAIRKWDRFEDVAHHAIPVTDAP